MFDFLDTVSATFRSFELSITCQVDLPDLSTLKGKYKSAAFRAINRAAKPIRERVIAEAQKIAKWGFLWKSIGTKTKLMPGGVFVTIIGPKMSYMRKKGKRGDGSKINHRPYLYAWLLEKGTKRSRMFPFLKPAWDAVGKEAFLNRARSELLIEFAKIEAKNALPKSPSGASAPVAPPADEPTNVKEAGDRVRKMLGIT